LRRNTTRLRDWSFFVFVPAHAEQAPEFEPGEPLRVNVILKDIQKTITGDSAVFHFNHEPHS
jgi:hypothetical protein